MPMPTYLVAFVISDYQIDTIEGFSPKTNTQVRVPGPDFIINNGLADYALNKSMILIDAFSEVRYCLENIYPFISV